TSSTLRSADRCPGPPSSPAHPSPQPPCSSAVAPRGVEGHDYFMAGSGGAGNDSVSWRGCCWVVWGGVGGGGGWGGVGGVGCGGGVVPADCAVGGERQDAARDRGGDRDVAEDGVASAGTVGRDVARRRP